MKFSVFVAPHTTNVTAPGWCFGDIDNIELEGLAALSFKESNTEKTMIMRRRCTDTAPIQITTKASTNPNLAFLLKVIKKFLLGRIIPPLLKLSDDFPVIYELIPINKSPSSLNIFITELAEQIIIVALRQMKDGISSWKNLVILVHGYYNKKS